MTNKLEVLQQLSFGNQIAEEEKDTLKDYFVQTASWQKILRGEIDVIYGPKGSGKSAIYVLVQDNSDQLFDKNVLLVSAENIRGDPAFKSLTLDPPTSEREFTDLWKLYFVTVIAQSLVDYDLRGAEVDQLTAVLRDNDLLPNKTTSLASILRAAQNYIRKYTNPTAIEGEMGVAPETGIHTFSGKLVFEEPTPDKERKGFVSVHQLFALADKALKSTGRKVWVLLDRLDVAFDETSDLERNALRALFRAYRDIRSFDSIILKVFLRTDIWARIADQGFREATHISRDITLKWEKGSLQNLVVRRLLNNPAIVGYYSVEKDDVLKDASAQEAFFNRVFPVQIERGEKQSSTMDWLIKRIADSRNEPAPRELVFFLNRVAEKQTAKLERGEEAPEGEALFDRSVFKEALPDLSEYRTTKMLFAEYPEQKARIEALRGEKTEQTLQSLSEVWRTDEETTRQTAQRLTDIGFFERRVARDNSVSYWVPFIYRPYLNLVQGKADSDAD